MLVDRLGNLPMGKFGRHASLRRTNTPRLGRIKESLTALKGLNRIG